MNYIWVYLIWLMILFCSIFTPLFKMSASVTLRSSSGTFGRFISGIFTVGFDGILSEIETGIFELNAILCDFLTLNGLGYNCFIAKKILIFK